MNISFYKKPKETPEGNVIFAEQVKIYHKNGRTLVDYHFFRPTPFFVDGHTHEMDELLNDKGWDTGMMGLTYKDFISPEEIIYCLSYKKAYERVYNSVVQGHHFRDVQMQIKDFLVLVDEEVAKIMKSLPIIVKNANDVTNLLEMEGFVQL